MDDNFKVGDKVTLTYMNRYDKRGVLNGPIVELSDANIVIKIGTVLTRVDWIHVIGVSL